jgi:hypothetical protein
MFASEKEWQAALLQEIDADQLPLFYGGTLTDPDGNGKCPSKVYHYIISHYVIYF